MGAPPIHAVADDAERRQFSAVLQTVFATDLPEDELAAAALTFEADRSLAIRDRGRIVATAGAYSFALTLPGRAQVPTAGVTMVGVLPSHRRRGYAGALMARQQDDIAARGEPLAALIASEYPIYGRFGYGPATGFARVSVDAVHARLAAPPAPGLSVRMPLAAEAADLLPRVFARHVAGRVGQVTRSAGVWQRRLRDPEHAREGHTAYRFALVEDAEGDPRGYALYRSKEEWSDHELAENRVMVEELVGIDDEAEAALWGFLFSIDLVTEVRAWNVPVDEPVRHRLVDARRWRTTAIADWLWVKAIDPAAALAARTYGAEDGLVLEVVDEFRPASGGRFRLRADAGGATCGRTRRRADLVLPAWALGSILLGGVAPTDLLRARRIEERTPGAAERADRLFLTRPAPWCSTHF